MNDYTSPEFWIASLTEIVIAIVAILVARGLFSAEEGQLWIQLAQVLIGPITVVVMALVARSYIGHMTAVRTARLSAGIRA